MCLCVYLLIKAYKCSLIHCNSDLCDCVLKLRKSDITETHTQTVCFLDSQFGKRQQGYFLWERCAHRGVYYTYTSERVSSDHRLRLCASNRVGSDFPVREGFYGGFAHIDHKLSSISYRLVRVHTCRRTRWGLITKLPGIQIKESSLKYTKQRH